MTYSVLMGTLNPITHSLPHSKALRYSTYFHGITQFYQHTLHFIRKRNEL